MIKTLELAKKAVSRLAEVAVTQKQFDAWTSAKKRQWLKDHPTSKFGKKEVHKAGKPIKQDTLKKAAATLPKDRDSVEFRKDYRKKLNDIKREHLNPAYNEVDDAIKALAKEPSTQNKARLKQANAKLDKAKKILDKHIKTFDETKYPS